jgi:hypothetical protein
MKTTPSTEPQAPAPVHAVSGAWTPLQTALFRNLWIATIRVSVSDRAIRQRAKQFLAEGESTRSQHWLADREA